MEPGKPIDYYSFLLRVWRVKEEHRQEWRASLENVESGEKRGFTSLIELQVYLALVTAACDENSSEALQTEAQGRGENPALYD